MTLKAGGTFLFGILALILSGCAGTAVTGDDYALVAHPPGLEYVAPTITKKEFEKSFFERYQWTYRPGGWPAADLVFRRIKDIYRGSRTYVRSKSLAEGIDEYFSTREITLGSKGKTKNVLGEVNFRYFSVDTVADCIFIEQGISRFSDQVELYSGADPLGDMIVRGWYCLKPSEPNQYALFRQFMDSIGIYGYAVPIR